MKNLKSIIALLVLTVFSVNVWGGTKTCTVTSSNPSSLTSPVTIDGVSWAYSLDGKNGTASETATKGNYSSTYGLKFGSSGSNYWSTVKLSTDYFSDKNITSVVVNVLNNGNQSATMTAKQGDVTIGSETKSFGQTYTNLTANTNTGKGGTLEITYAVAQASCFHSFTITYEDCTPAGTDLSITSANSVKSGKTITLASTGGNGGTVEWSVTNGTGTASISNGILTAGKVGTVTVKAHQDQNGQICETNAQQVFTITPITFTDYITECSSDPSISVSTAELSGFTYIYSQGPSAAQTVTVNGFYLQNNVTVTASDNYEICLSQDGSYTSSITLTPVDQMVNAPVYVRLKAGKDVNSYNGTLTVASSGLDSKNVTLSGSVSAQPLAKPSVTATPGVHQITLSWAAVDNADSYQLVWNNGTPETVTSPVTKTDLTGGQSYSYSLVAIGTGNYSNSEAAASSAIAGKETFTVKFFNSGTELTNLERNIEEGATFGTLPTLNEESDACDPHSRTFVGWMIGTIDGKQQTAPTMVSTTTPVTEAMTLNAVWATKEGNENQYKRVKQLSELSAGTKIVIIDDYNSKIFKNNLSSADAPTESNDLISVTPSTDTWTLGGNSTDGWTLSNSSGKLGIATLPTSNSNNKSKPISITNTNSTWTIGASTATGIDNCFYIKSKDHDAGLEFSSNNWIAYYNNSESNMASSTWFTERLYIPSLSYSNYITTCSEDPLIEVSPASLTGFSTIATTGNPSAAQSFTVEGYNLTENISVSAPAGYEVSSDNSNYSNSLSLTQTDGKVAKTTVYVRLAAADAAAASVAGNISLTSAGATEKNVALSGTVLAKTLQSISVKTAPTKTTYTLGETFDPTGLVITATYNSGNEEVAYSGHEDEFTFSPTLETALTASDNKVTITWGGQSKDQSITMQCNVAWMVNGQPWEAGTPTTLVNVGSAITEMPTDPTSEACNGKTFVGWSATTIAKTDDEPALLTKVADFTTLNAHTTYHAVFAKASSEGAAPVNTVLWGENFAHFGTNTPSAAGTGTGTTIYDGASITYAQSSNNTKGYSTDLSSGGNAAPELLLSKDNQTWTISGIKSGKAKKSSLVFVSNRTTFSLTCSSDAYKVEGSQKSWTLTLKEGQTAPETFNLVLKNTGSNNARVDDVVLKITEAGITYSDYVTQCTPTYTVNFFTNSGDAEPYATQKVEEGSKATAPETEPSKAGATFAGWFTANDEALADKTITEATDFIAKWNYTAPVITTQPASGEYQTNATVTLLVVATEIEGVTFSYQWQEKISGEYVNISGATLYYYEPSTSAIGTRTYRCVVTNGEASTASNEAVISIHEASFCAMPTITIPTGTNYFMRTAKVTLASATDGATIYYTTNGENPTLSSQSYTAPFNISAMTTIKAIADKQGLTTSNVAEATFTPATMQSIEVKTEPKKEYTALETFDPAGLVITANYDYSLSEEIDYANHSGEFTFTPTLTTELGVDVEAVKIGWGGKEVEQQITVNCIAIDAPAVDVSKQGSTGITLTWSAINNAVSYQVKWNGGEAEPATSPYVKTGLTDNTNYTYEVIAVGETNYCTSTTGVQNVKTNTKSCESITNPSIDKVPTEFYVGEEVLRTHFKVDKNYDNGEVINDNPSSITLPDGIANPLTNDAVGTQTVTLTFISKTTTIEITVKPQPVVTWSINGNEDNKQSFAYNAALVLPENPAAPQSCAEKIFVGWTTETYKDHEGDAAPGVLFTEAGDRKVTEDVTYYAVFAMVNEVPDEVDVIDNAATKDEIGETGTTAWIEFVIDGGYGAQYNIRTMGIGENNYAMNFNKNGYFYATATATSGKYLKSITINGANKKFDIYASNSAYSEKPTENRLAQIEVSGNTATYNFTSNYKYIAVNGTESSSTITSVEIVYAGVNTVTAYSTTCAARTPQSIAITHEATTTTFDVNDAFTSEGLEITAYYDSGDPQVVTGYCVITAPDMTTANEKDVNISYTENDATVNTSYKINVRQPYYVMYKPNGATTGSVPSDTKKYYTGEKVTVLANESLVKTDNVFKGWSYAGVTYQADDQITVGTENITLTAVWEEKMPCTITLSENGNISTVTDKSTGDTYNLPTTITNNVDGYAFMGWSTQEIDDPVATTEQGTFFAKGEEITLINNAYTFYAVYARTSGTSSDYNAGKVTTDADIVAGGLYIIEQAGHVLSSPASDKKAPTEATYKKSGLSSTESYVWTLETSTNGFYLKNMSDNKYLKENGGDMSSVTSNMSEWKFAFQTAGYWKISSADDRYLGFNSSNTYLYKAYANTHYNLTLVNVQYAAQINIYRLVGGYTTAPTLVVDGTDITEIPTDFHGNVIVEDVGDVTLNEATTWKNLTIKNGAKVTTNAALTIKDLLIETKMGAGTGKTNSPNMKGACGQLIIGDGGSVTASGSAIIENQIDPTGTATQGWYSFSVPFPVSAQNGIYFGETKLTNGVDYAIMEYLGDVRAQGQYGWKKYSGILQPGKMYVIAVTDSDFGKLRFKKTADGDLIATNSWTAGIYGGGDDANWNAIGNPNLAIAQFVNNSGANTLQLYDHTTNTFTGYDKSKLNIVVGSGFFIQAVKDHPNITMKVAEGDRGYRAPVEDIEEMPFVAIQLLQGEAMSDQVFLNADVNATLSYEIGRDVAKFFMQGEAKCAQIYVPAYGTNLCAAQFPLNAYDETMFPLTITAPKEGTYTIAAENVPENVDLFLEQNGALIWNLSTSAYEINLNKGETKDYSIRWNAHSSSTPTGNNSIKSDAKVQKIFYQQNIYILQENQMYNAQGVKVQ